MLIAFLGKQSARHAFVGHHTAATTEFAFCCDVCKELHMLGTSLNKQTGEISNVP